VVERYLRAFGPAMTVDLQWWTGWTMSATRTAVHALHAVEVSLDDGGTGWVMPDDVAPADHAGPSVALLPSLDPSPMGW
jgi:hypothetical protein